MKLEQLIVQHLYNNKSVTLQGIGTIHLNPSVVLPAEGDKEATIPENAFSFDYNLKAGEDDALIAFIVQQTRKIKPLATSDLESYSMLAKQFLNIGKPLSIEGVGTIVKNQAGLYEFKQGSFVTPKIGDIAREVKEKTEESISFESAAPKNDNGKKILMAVFIIAFIVIAGLGLYYFFFKKTTPVTETAEQVQPQQVQDTIKTDTTHTSPVDSAITAKPVETVPEDSFSFKIVIKEYPDEAAINKAFEKLSSYGHKLVIIKADSTRYQLAIPFTTSLTDTVRAKDSLKRFFGGKPYVLLK